MDEVLAALQRRFIEGHLLAPTQAVEQIMTRHLVDVLRDARLLNAYKRNVHLGAAEFLVPFAFAHMTGEHRADRALRPLNFDLASPTDIYNHGDEWGQRLHRLRRHGFRPDRCLIATRPPGDEDPLKLKAYAEIRSEFLEEEIEWVTEDETSKIITFARFPEPDDLTLVP
jgi:hypothetical protein